MMCIIISPQSCKCYYKALINMNNEREEKSFHVLDITYSRNFDSRRIYIVLGHLGLGTWQ